MKVVKHSSRPIEKLISTEEKGESEKKEDNVEEKKTEGKEEK